MRVKTARRPPRRLEPSRRLGARGRRRVRRDDDVGGGGRRDGPGRVLIESALEFVRDEQPATRTRRCSRGDPPSAASVVAGSRPAARRIDSAVSEDDDALVDARLERQGALAASTVGATAKHAHGVVIANGRVVRVPEGRRYPPKISNSSRREFSARGVVAREVFSTLAARQGGKTKKTTPSSITRTRA